MKAWAWVCVAAMAFGMAGVAACGNGGGAKFSMGQKAGEMPSGETWVGVYYNPVYGYLHMIEQDGNIVGRWKRTDGSHWGELSGNAEGNVLHFTWKEHQYGGVGPSAEAHGSGVFVFKPGQNDIPELGGQYALDDSENVGDWHCVKQKNMKPDLSSINGDNPTSGTPATTDQWK
jgi:hypothetical protein